MSKIESSRSKVESKRTGTMALVLAFTMAAFSASGAVYGAKPKPGPDINDAVCTSISGVWTSHTCTIPAGSDGVASSNFKISKGNTLDVMGSLTINAEVTISNAGTIIVENVTGVTPEYGDPGVMAGILVLGALDNSGAITIKNVTDNTEGIAISALFGPNDPPVPNPYLVVPGVLTNSGTITIQNTGQTQGINNNLGVLNNSASGTITVVNSLTSSVGIRNERLSTITNAGSMTIANSGEVAVGSVSGGRGISNAGFFTNAATGTFTISPSGVEGDTAWGLRNNGVFTSFGTFINNRGSYNNIDPLSSTWGSYNLSPGAMMNYGKTYVGTPSDPRGTFYSEFLMMNLGEITSYGVLDGGGYINYATFYNYGLINGGENVGLCIDEPGSSGGC